MTSASARESESLEFVERSIASVPAALEGALGVALPHASHRALRVVTTGIGASEGPARLLAMRLANAGLAARFVPTSIVATAELPADLVVAFSQGISPNARLALVGPNDAIPRWLVTSIHGDEDDARGHRFRDLVSRGVHPIVVPPRDENGTLVRFVGPTVASLVALRLARHLGDDSIDADGLAESPTRYAIATHHPAPSLPIDRPIALVTAGTTVEEAFAIRWKLLETFLVADPPTWDVLSFAHGPVQAMEGSSLALVVLETPDAHPFVERLRRSVGERHAIVGLLSSRSDAIATLEHVARLDASILATLRASPRNLFVWPRMGDECPLYRLGELDR